MYEQGILVEPRDNYILFVKLSNGKVGEFDVSRYLNKGIFRELRDHSYFKQVRPAFGGVVWPHEQDFSADTIEVEMRELEGTNA
jgi:hypothetical protein